MRITIEQALELEKSDPLMAGQWLDALLEANRNEPEVICAAATNLMNRGWNGLAYQLYERVIRLAPNAPFAKTAWNNMGVCMRSTNEVSAAVSCFKNALLFGETPTNLSNLASCYINSGEPDMGLKYAGRALAIDPSYGNALHNRALALLETGDYKNAWEIYDHRMVERKQMRYDRPSSVDFGKREYGCPMWDGRKTGVLVVHGEQGVGDEIMFGSLIERCKPLCDQLILECHKKLVKTYERSFGVPCYATPPEVLSRHKPDSWAAVGSLPRILGVDRPEGYSGYLKPDEERVARWKELYPSPRVGISWRGGTPKTHENLRNFVAPIWKPLTDTMRMISLQYDDWGAEVDYFGLHKTEPVDFDDHMALVKSCDLVISVCNTTVHMAGSMGVPCWCLVPSKPAWRYGLGGEKMPWYSSVKLYRQKPGEKWKDVIGRLVTDLEASNLMQSCDKARLYG